MESTPDNIRIDHIREEILSINGVQRIDDFHCWAIAGGKNMLTAHIRLSPLHSECNNHSNQVRRVHHEAMLIIE